MSMLILPRSRTTQPDRPVDIDRSNRITNGLKLAVNLSTKSTVEPATHTSINYNSGVVPAPIVRVVHRSGLSLSNAVNGTISAPAWVNITNEGTFLLLAKRHTTSNNQAFEMGSASEFDHLAWSGLVYSDAFSAARWINGVAPPASKALTNVFQLILTVKAGYQIAWWDDIRWVSNTLSMGFVMPSTLTLAHTNFDGVVFLACAWDRALDSAEILQLYKNPWQIFEKDKLFVYINQSSGDVTLTPALFTNSNGFYSPILSANYELIPSSLSNTNSFYAQSISADYSIAPSLFNNTNSFYAQVLTATYDLTPDLFNNSNAFYSHNLTLINDLTPTLVTNSNAFYTPTVVGGNVELLPELLTNASIFYAASALSSNELLPALVTNNGIFYSHNLALINNLTPAMVSNSAGFYTHEITGGDNAEQYPLAGQSQTYPLSGQSQTYPLSGQSQTYPLSGLI